MESLVVILVASFCGAESLEQRVVHNDPAKYVLRSEVHDGAGSMKYQQFIDSSALSTNFYFFQGGEILPKGGIGHHFHHQMEEMYVILEGEVEMTINGRTARVKGPAVIPCKMGQSHGLYNSSDSPVRWLNFAVTAKKGKPDAFDLNDNRVGAVLDPTPVFVTASLDGRRLGEREKMYGGQGTVHHRRVLPSQVFRTAWSYVDHVVIPPGASIGAHRLNDLEEVYYVIDGAGRVQVDGEQARLAKGNAIPIRLGEEQSFASADGKALELLVVGITKEKGGSRPGDAMLLEIFFKISKDRAAAFEKMYAEVYVPALREQQGYIRSNLLRLFPEKVANEIEAKPTEFNYQMQLVFDTEENRRKWVASKEHEVAWPAASSMAEKIAWRGFDVVAKDRVRD